MKITKMATAMLSNMTIVICHMFTGGSVHFLKCPEIVENPGRIQVSIKSSVTLMKIKLIQQINLVFVGLTH